LCTVKTYALLQQPNAFCVDEEHHLGKAVKKINYLLVTRSIHWFSAVDELHKLT
jgi:hypothetical protein